MFRCSECQKEYEEKPQYCDDCGNDVFEEIKPEIKIKKEPENKKQEEIKPKSKQNQEQKKEIKPEEILSYAIFLTCIILSFIIVFFVNPEPKIEEQTIKNEEIKPSNIPSLDSFWNNKPPKNTNISAKPIQTTEIRNSQETEIVNDSKPKQDYNKEKPVQKIAVVPLVKNQPKKQEPPKQTQVKTTPKIQTQTVQNSKTKIQPKVQTQAQSKTQTAKTSQPISIQSNQPIIWNYNQTQNQNTQQVKPQAQTIQQSPDKILASKKELANYKTNLRNTIGRKVNFEDVIGDGTCTIGFKIDSNGKLINRSFLKQSTNSTLNDAIYKAIMQTPSYNPPPAAYNGETLSLKITFYNGNFEISLN